MLTEWSTINCDWDLRPSMRVLPRRCCAQFHAACCCLATMCVTRKWSARSEIRSYCGFSNNACAVITGIFCSSLQNMARKSNGSKVPTSRPTELWSCCPVQTKPIAMQSAIAKSGDVQQDSISKIQNDRTYSPWTWDDIISINVISRPSFFDNLTRCPLPNQEIEVQSCRVRQTQRSCWRSLESYASFAIMMHNFPCIETWNAQRMRTNE